MEITINTNSLDSAKIEDLREILENNRIKIINNDNLKSENEIKIVYDDEPIEMNEKFNSKVKLIRNKYYRQLLNIINSVNKIILKHEENFTIAQVPDQSHLVTTFVESKSYKDMVKMALINYIGVYNFDNIFELTKDEIIELKKYMQLNNDSDYITRLLGMYVNDECKEGVLRLLEHKIYGSKLDKIKECKNFILMCPEIIQEFCIKYFKQFEEECGIKDIFELYTIIFNKVLVHEIGHSVFDYINDFENERRANYFASLTFDGTFDKIIQNMTEIQRGSYKVPKLINDSIETITEKVYKIKNSNDINRGK